MPYEEKPDRSYQPSLFLFIQLTEGELQVIQYIVSGYVTYLENNGVSSEVYKALSTSIAQKITARLFLSDVAETTVFTERELQFIAAACRSFILHTRAIIPQSQQRDQILGRAEKLCMKIHRALSSLN